MQASCELEWQIRLQKHQPIPWLIVTSGPESEAIRSWRVQGKELLIPWRK